MLNNWMRRISVGVEYAAEKRKNGVKEEWIGRLVLGKTSFKTKEQFQTKQRENQYCALFALYTLGYFHPERI